MSRLINRAAISAATLFSIFFLTFSSPSFASVILYGTIAGFGSGGGEDPTGPGTGGGGGNKSALATVNQSTGALTIITDDIGFGGSLSALAADSSGHLFTVKGGRREGILRSDGTCCRGAPVSELISVDRDTGAGTSLGPTNIESRGADPLDPDPPGEFGQFGSQRQNVSDMSFDSSDSLFGIVGRGTQLGNFDDVLAGTGFANKIGDTICLDSNCSRGNALAFDEFGTLFLAASIRSGIGTQLSPLDPATGMLLGGIVVDFSLLGDPDPSEEFRIGGMDFHPLTGELYVAVTQGEAGTLPPANSILGILDTTSGLVTPIGETGEKLEGLAFVTTPEPGTLLLLAMGLAGIGFGRARSRRN